MTSISLRISVTMRSCPSLPAASVTSGLGSSIMQSFRYLPCVSMPEAPACTSVLLPTSVERATGSLKNQNPQSVTSRASTDELKLGLTMLMVRRNSLAEGWLATGRTISSCMSLDMGCCYD